MLPAFVQLLNILATLGSNEVFHSSGAVYPERPERSRRANGSNIQIFNVLYTYRQ
jgi:hypothetical protein